MRLPPVQVPQLFGPLCATASRESGSAFLGCLTAGQVAKPLCWSSPPAPFIPAANITGKHDLPGTHQIGGVLVDRLVHRVARVLPRRVVADHGRHGQSEALDPAHEVPSQPLRMPSGQGGNDDLVKVSAADRVLNSLPCIRASDAARDGLTGGTPKQRHGRVERPVRGRAVLRVRNEQREFACAGSCPATHLRKQPWRCGGAICHHKHTGCSHGRHQPRPITTPSLADSRNLPAPRW